jgi:protein SCO1/2
MLRRQQNQPVTDINGVPILMTRKVSMFPIIVLVLSLIVVSFGIYQMNKMPDSAFPQVKGEFTLHHADGTFSFKDMAGKSGLILFGYTHCPDVCPAALVNIANALNLLDESELEKIRALFISLDPKRDTPEKITKYAKYFHPKIIGLSGSEKEVLLAAKSFYAAREINKPNEKGNYTVNHTTTLYMIRPDGMVGEIISYKSTPEEIAKALRRWLPWAD